MLFFFDNVCVMPCATVCCSEHVTTTRERPRLVKRALIIARPSARSCPRPSPPVQKLFKTIPPFSLFVPSRASTVSKHSFLDDAVDSNFSFTDSMTFFLSHTPNRETLFRTETGYRAVRTVRVYIHYVEFCGGKVEKPA